MKVYISASWKQRERVRALAVCLREVGHEVYDFTDPACRKSEEIPPERFPHAFDPAAGTYREYITSNPHWREAVTGNRAALQWCDVVILLLPAGADAHSDWALGVGLGKLSCIVGHPPAGERTPSHLWADALLDADSAVSAWLAPPVPVQRVCLRQREGSYTPRCGGATLAPFVTGRRDLVTCQQCLAIPLPWDGEAARAGLASASAEMVAWAKSVREPTAEELAVAEARTEAIKAALYPSPPGQALPVELQVNVTISGAPDAGALSDAIVDACREIAERGA